ncbi:hypothetical protein BC941DRAFT_435826 [Chlamydoabsidia padenii]|nr:hypothetical protein BC941DRAFT_435826 [Chlamydoabsidia padenii]
MTPPFENTLFSFTSPQGILRDHLRNSLLAYQTRTMLGRANSSSSSFRRPRTRTHPKEFVSLLESYSHGPPVYPSYLYNTVYALLVEEQYNHYCQKYGANKKNKKNNKNNNNQRRISTNCAETSSSFDTTTTSAQRNQPWFSSDATTDSTFFDEVSLGAKHTHYFSSGDLLLASHSSLTCPSYGASNYNTYLSKLELQDLRLPTAWSTTERGEGLELGQEWNEITYKVKIEPGAEDNDGHIAIGFCGEYSRLDRLPGCDEYSWGFHGENGSLTGGSTGQTKRRKYEACFGVGDTIGCGIDFSNNTLFYTKNGIYLGTAFWNINGKHIYPFIGFKNPGDKITANFGQGSSFIFDIGQHRKGITDQLIHKVLSRTLLADPSVKNMKQQQHEQKPKTLSMDQLVMDYLNHAGYIDTCLKMKDEIHGGIDGKEQERFKIRQDICAALLNGHIDQVFIKCEQHYPQMLSRHPRLLFRLECLKFIDLVNSLDNQRKPPKKRAGTQAGDKRRRSTVEKDDDPMDVDDDGGYRSSDLQNVMDFGRYLHETYAPESTSSSSTTSSTTISNIHKMMDDDDGDDGDTKDNSLAGIDVKSELMATFSTLAYSKPTDNPNAYLCESSWREGLVSDMNNAILATEGKHPVSCLERIYRQANVTIHELVLNGDGQASMIPNLDDLI